MKKVFILLSGALVSFALGFYLENFSNKTDIGFVTIVPAFILLGAGIVMIAFSLMYIWRLVEKRK